MTNRPDTLLDVFAIRDADLSGRRFRGLESAEGMRSLKLRLASQIKDIRWPLAFDEIVDQIGGLFNIGVLDILAAAWNKSRQLLKCADRSACSPEESFLVPLADHMVKSVHHPHLDILSDDRPIGRIDFEISVSLSVQGIVLKIQAGRIKEILAGSCKGKGALKCEKFLLLEKETKSFPLAGIMGLGEGIPIKG